MFGATSSLAGSKGLVPAPQAGDEGKALMGSGLYAPVGGVDAVQTSATTGATIVTSWGSVVLIPTLTGNLTITLPTVVGNTGKKITFLKTGTSNAFIVTIAAFVGQSVALQGAGSELSADGGALTVEAIDATNARQVSNIGTAPVLAEFGENTATTDAQTFNNTLTTLTGSSFTLPTVGTWDVDYTVCFGANTPTAEATFGVYNSSNVLVPNSGTSVASISGTLTDSISASGRVRIITTGSSTYSIKAQGFAGGVTFRVHNNFTAGANNTGMTKTSWNKVGGFSPTIGTSVDYSFIQDAIPGAAVSVANGAAILYTGTGSNSGSLPYNAATGQWTLTAGVTYALDATASSGTSGGISYQWHNDTTVLAVGSIGFVNADSGTSGNQVQPIASYTFTPTTTTLVSVRNISGAARNYPSLAAGAVSNFAKVTQLGTSAISQFIGATSVADGFRGFVPTPTAGQQASVLLGDGTWSALAATTPLSYVFIHDTVADTGYSGAVATNVTYGGGETIDTDSAMVPATGIYTAPRAGLYRIESIITWRNQSVKGDDTMNHIIAKNNAPYLVEVVDPGAIVASGEEVQTIATGILQLASGDTIAIQLSGVDDVIDIVGKKLSITQLPSATSVDPGTVPVATLAYGRMYQTGGTPAVVPTAGAPYVTSGLDATSLLSGGTTGTPATASFVIGTAGSYKVRAFGNTRGTSGASGMVWGVYVNGALSLQGSGPVTDTASDDLSITVEGRLPLNLAIGDVVALRPTTGTNAHAIQEFEIEQIAPVSVIAAGAASPATGSTAVTAGNSGYANVTPAIADNSRALFGDMTFKSPTQISIPTLTAANTTSETVVAKFLIPAGTLRVSEPLTLAIAGTMSGIATAIYQVRYGPLGTTADPLMMTLPVSGAGVNNAIIYLDAILGITATGSAMFCGGKLQFAGTSIGPTSFSFPAAAPSLDYYVSVTATLGGVGTHTIRLGKLTY
jgi:hypothetical protein